MSRFRQMCASFKNRKRYSSLKQWSTVVLFVVMVVSSAEAAWYSYVLSDVGPAYMEAFNRVHSWSDFGITGVACTVVMLMLFISAWFFGSLARGCMRVLDERIFR